MTRTEQGSLTRVRQPGPVRVPRDPHPSVRPVLGIAAWASLAFVVLLWLHGGALQDLAAGGGSAVTAAGRITGLVAADLLLIQVFLMARVPWVERTWGQDQLVRWHRWVGFISFNLVLVHIALVVLGYATSDGKGIVSETVDLVVTYPGMLLAVASLGCMVAVVITSLRAARRRLRYESWHLLHLYGYLGVGLAIPHQIWTGTDFIPNAAARLFWWTSYVVCAGSVVLFRVGIPLWRNLRHRLVVSRVVVEGPGVVSVHLTGHRLDRLPVRAGQFFVWRFLDGPGWTRGNPYSLSAAPDGGSLRITAKDAGDGSARLASLRPGTRAIIEGPYGGLTGARRRRHRVLLIAGGIGITPLRALLDEPDYNRGEAVLLYRARDADELVFRDELAALAEHRGVRVEYLIGPRAPGRWLPGTAPKVSDATLLRRLLPDVASYDVFLCGPSPWMTTVQASVLQAGVPADQVHVERFDW
ncbi:MAG: oxidoreductase [Frankiales bacterium]|nr:oxidoreductase [Frankiales bacterium]